MKNFNYAKLGMRIQKLREEQKLTQEKLAEKADISKNYLSELERGIRGGKLDVYYRLAYALGISLDVLVDNVPQNSIMFSNYIFEKTKHFSKDQKKALDECIRFIDSYDMQKRDNKTHIY